MNMFKPFLYAGAPNIILHWPGTVIHQLPVSIEHTHLLALNRRVYTIICKGNRITVGAEKLRRELDVVVPWMSCGWWPDRKFWTNSVKKGERYGE